MYAPIGAPPHPHPLPRGERAPERPGPVFRHRLPSKVSSALAGRTAARRALTLTPALSREGRGRRSASGTGVSQRSPRGEGQGEGGLTAQAGHARYVTVTCRRRHTVPGGRRQRGFPTRRASAAGRAHEPRRGPGLRAARRARRNSPGSQMAPSVSHDHSIVVPAAELWRTNGAVRSAMNVRWTPSHCVATRAQSGESVPAPAGLSALRLTRGQEAHSACQSSGLAISRTRAESSISASKRRTSVCIPQSPTPRAITASRQEYHPSAASM